MHDYFTEIGLVVVCCTLLAWVTNLIKQPLILGYVVAGILLGPWGLDYIPSLSTVSEISHVGIALLLFLAGLVLHPSRLAQLPKQTLTVVLGGYAFTLLTVFPALLLMGYEVKHSLIASGALMFSSTILVVKLLPTNMLHQRRMGSICIAILIAQDITAVLLMMLFTAPADGNLGPTLILLFGKAALLVLAVLLLEQYALRPMMIKSQHYEELLVMLGLAWCLGCAIAAKEVGLSHEVGAFLGGVALARDKIARVIADKLEPLRDFFLLLFFFTLGAKLDLGMAKNLWLYAIILATVVVALRPHYYRWLFVRVGETPNFARETGYRLGQSSEFALLIAVIGLNSGTLNAEISQLIQITTILTILISSYWVVLRFPTPIAVSKELKKN